jgi:ubiquinone/menaquinone biosynthesis C-methylase UbiE
MADAMAGLGLAASIARWIILRAQNTNQKGSGGYSAESFAAVGDVRPFPQADVERDQFDDFFKLFPAFPLVEAIRGRDLLDFGSGYGGKTVEYKVRGGAKRVCGVEPFASMVARSREYAASRGVDDVEFEVCSSKAIPYPDASFDVAVSHDVLEHVEDPRLSLSEIRRVLRPGGLSVNVFPLYFGAMSHHLDYVARVPGLHWVFSPQTLVRAVNDVLARHPQFGTARQPEPGRSFDGARNVLPGLNGLSGIHLEELFARFETVVSRRIAIGPRGMGLIVRSSLPAQLRDLVTGTFACILRKPI